MYEGKVVLHTRHAVRAVTFTRFIIRIIKAAVKTSSVLYYARDITQSGIICGSAMRTTEPISFSLNATIYRERIVYIIGAIFKQAPSAIVLFGPALSSSVAWTIIVEKANIHILLYGKQYLQMMRI